MKFYLKVLLILRKIYVPLRYAILKNRVNSSEIDVILGTRNTISAIKHSLAISGISPSLGDRSLFSRENSKKYFRNVE